MKEGGLETLLQVSFIVLIGSLVSNLVCVMLWPQRAADNLKNNMTETLNSFSTILSTLTDIFLLEEPLHRLSYEKLQKAINRHQASFTSLTKNLAEAQSERWFGGPSKASNRDNRDRHSSGQAYEDAIDSLTRLGQHLNGLRSGTSLQYNLIKAHRDGKLVLKTRSVKQRSSRARGYSSASAVEGKGKRVEETGSYVSQGDDENAMLQAAADTFGELVDDLGPPLKALSVMRFPPLHVLLQCIYFIRGLSSPTAHCA